MEKAANALLSTNVVIDFDWKKKRTSTDNSSSTEFAEVLNYRLNHGDLIRRKGPEMVAIKEYILEEIEDHNVLKVNHVSSGKNGLLAF